MSVSKINGIRAPYRSDTFRQLSHELVNASRLLSIDGEITSSGGSVTVPPLSFIQDGLVVKKTTSTTKTSPSLDAPYYLSVTAPSLGAIDDLDFFFTRSPHDIPDSAVVVGIFDGSNWKTEKSVSLAGLSESLKDLVVGTGQTGGIEGLQTSYTSATDSFTLSSGSLFDSAGEMVSFEGSASFPKAASDPSLLRVDRVVYRRGADTKKRSGVRKYLTGSTYADAITKINEDQVAPSSSVRGRVRVLVKPDNTAYVLHVKGYGDSSLSVMVDQYSADRATQTTLDSLDLGMTSRSYDAALDESGAIHFVYEKAGDICWRKWTSAAGLSNEVVVEGGSSLSANPRCFAASNGNLFVAYDSLIGTNNREIMFSVRAANGSAVVAPKNISLTGGECETPAIFVEDDLRVHAVWRDKTQNKITYAVLDDAGFTQSTRTVSGAVYDRRNSAQVADTRLCKLPEIAVSDNQEPVVAFIKVVSSSDESDSPVALWKGSGSAFIPSGLPSMGSVASLCLLSDPVSCDPVFSVASSAGVHFFKESGGSAAISFQLSTSGSSVHSARDLSGSLFHAWAAARSTSYTSGQTGLKLDYTGPRSVTGSITSVNLFQNQCLIRKGASTTRPLPEEKITFASGTAGNNITSVITASETVSVNAAGDFYKLTLADNFGSSANETSSSASASTQLPAGNEVRTAKTASELRSRAFAAISPKTDVVLSKISYPGPTVRNWISRQGTSLETAVAVGTAAVSWSGSALTLGSGLFVVDLYANESFTVTGGTYTLGEGEALYVELTGGGGTTVPTAVPIQSLPWDTSFAVLGIRSQGKFNPVLLSGSGFGQLDQAESVVFGQDLPTSIRTRLGITSETEFEAYTSTLGISSANSYASAISNLDLMAGQNPHIKVTGLQGDWGMTTSGSVWISSDALINLPGVTGARNKIAGSQAVALSDGEVAYVTLNRSGTAETALTISKTLLSNLTPGRDTFPLFMRSGTDLFLPTGRKIPHGTSFGRGEDTLAKALRYVDLADFTTSSLPSSVPTVAGTTVTNRMTVLYGHSSLNKIYLARISGSSVTWEALPVFNGSSTPSTGDHCFVGASSEYPDGMDYFFKGSWRSVRSPNFASANISTTGTLSSGAATVTSLNAGSGAIQTTGTLSAGAATVASLNAGSGAIQTTGTVSAGPLTATSLNAGSGAIQTTGTLSAGAATVASLNAGSGAIQTTGTVSAGPVTATSLNAGSGAVQTTGTLSAGAATVASLNAGSGAIQTTGTVSAGPLTATSLNAGSGAIQTTGTLSAGAATVASLNAGSGAIQTTGVVSTSGMTLSDLGSSGSFDIPAAGSGSVILRNGTLYLKRPTGFEAYLPTSVSKNYLQEWFWGDRSPTVNSIATATSARGTATLQSSWVGITPSSSMSISSQADATVRGSYCYVTSGSVAGNSSGTVFIETPVFTIDPVDVGSKPVFVNFEFGGAGAATDWDVVVVRYNSSGTYQGLIQLTGKRSAATSGTALIPGTSPNTAATFHSYFRSGATSTDLYALRFRKLTSTTSAQLKITSICAYPRPIGFGGFSTDWFDDGASTITTGGFLAAAPSKGTRSLDKIMFRYTSLNTISCLFNYKQTAAGSVGVGQYFLKIPNSHSVDNAYMQISPVVGLTSYLGSFPCGYASVSDATKSGMLGMVTCGYVSVGLANGGDESQYVGIRFINRVGSSTTDDQTWSAGAGFGSLGSSNLYVSASFEVPVL